MSAPVTNDVLHAGLMALAKSIGPNCTSQVRAAMIAAMDRADENAVVRNAALSEAYEACRQKYLAEPDTYYASSGVPDRKDGMSACMLAILALKTKEASK